MFKVKASVSAEPHPGLGRALQFPRIFSSTGLPVPLVSLLVLHRPLPDVRILETEKLSIAQKTLGTDGVTEARGDVRRGGKDLDFARADVGMSSSSHVLLL